MVFISINAETIYEARVWSAGSDTPVITIPKMIRDYKGYKVGDVLSIAIIEKKGEIDKQEKLELEDGSTQKVLDEHEPRRRFQVS